MGATQKRTVLITGYASIFPHSQMLFTDIKTHNSCSAGGSGHALALEFAARGLRVFATARSRASLVDLEGKGIETFALDVTKTESITALKDEITKHTGGKLDILFNNAGTSFVFALAPMAITSTEKQVTDRLAWTTVYQMPAIEADPAAVRHMYNTNVFGLFDMVTAFTPLLMASVQGSQLPPTIVNVASIAARMPLIFASAYNASKAAVAQYSDTLRLELAPLGVKVVTLYMGEVSTGLMQADSIKFKPDSIYIDFEARARDANNKHHRESIKAEEFARKVVSEVVVKKPGFRDGVYLWLGTNAWIIWFLNAFGPRKVFNGIAEGMAGFNEKGLRQSLLARSQRSNTSA